METLEQIKADAVEVFHFDRECRPQDRAHAYLGKYRVRRGYNDTAMQVAVTDMIERALRGGKGGGCRREPRAEPAPPADEHRGDRRGCHRPARREHGGGGVR